MKGLLYLFVSILIVLFVAWTKYFYDLFGSWVVAILSQVIIFGLTFYITMNIGRLLLNTGKTNE